MKVFFATVEDYCGLWDAVWELNPIVPDLNKRQEIAYQVVTKLLKNSLVKLYYYQLSHGEIGDVEIGYIEGILADKKNWEAPPKFTTIAVGVGATPLGEQTYWKAEQMNKLPDGLLK